MFVCFLSTEQNGLQGSLPTEIALLSSLSFFDMHMNAMVGPIPTELSKLQELKVLDLEFNLFSGTIPVMRGFSSMNAFRVSNNMLTGSVPEDLMTEMPNLEELWIARNQLTGPIPTSIGFLTNLSTSPRFTTGNRIYSLTFYFLRRRFVLRLQQWVIWNNTLRAWWSQHDELPSSRQPPFWRTSKGIV